MILNSNFLTPEAPLCAIIFGFGGSSDINSTHGELINKGEIYKPTMTNINTNIHISCAPGIGGKYLGVKS